MTHLFHDLPFRPDSRMTGVWTNENWSGHSDDDLVLGTLIDLGGEQDGGVESDFLSTYLPFHVGGFHGMGPNGAPFTFILQVAPAGAQALVGQEEPLWPVRDGLSRALRLNHEASIRAELGWTRGMLELVYAEAGVDAIDLADWPIVDLVRGLLAECCYVDLIDIVDGHDAGCAFPGLDHDCTGDVFSDVFARWAQGLLAAPEDVEDDDAYDDDDEDIEITVELLESFTTKQLRVIARELGVRTTKAGSRKKRSRASLITRIMAEFERDAEEG